MLLPSRHGSASPHEYRYGFNGMEKDNELKGGEGNSINYEARVQDTRIGRFLSIDPLTKSFPHYSPYQFAGNTPIQAIDLDGAEEYHYLAKWDKKSGKILFAIENEKTVYRKSFLGYTWIPNEEHTVVYQSSSGEKTEYVFPKEGKHIQYGPTSIPETLNLPASLRKFVSDSKKIRYQNEDDAEAAFSKDFLSTSSEYLMAAANAMIVYAEYSTPVEKTPIQEESVIVTRVQTEHPQSKRISVNKSGDIHISGESKLYITIDDANHVNYYYNKKGASEGGASITSFRVKKEVADEIRRTAVPQKQAKAFPDSPEQADITKSKSAYGLPAKYIKKLQEGAVKGSATVTTP